VQRSFTKRHPGFHKLSYKSRLKRLALERLEIRRLHEYLTMCLKIVHNLVISPFDQFFFKLSQHKGRRDYPLQLFNTDYRLNVRPSFFLGSCKSSVEPITC